MKARISFENKAQSLLNVAPYLGDARVAPLQIYSVSEWGANSQRIVESIQQNFASKTLIVRSCAATEDAALESFAGHFLSIADIEASNTVILRKAIEDVLASYQGVSGDHNFFVQEQVTNITMCGVMFTCDLDTLAPYYIVNYDESGSNESVTSGAGNALKTYIRAHCSPNNAATPELESLVRLGEELMDLSGNAYLDIEFAVTASRELYLLQVRPIVTTGKPPAMKRERHALALQKIEKKAKKLASPHPGLEGKQGVYSVMTDWNPAEMIGRRPRRLALSLYKELITDAIWAYQRDNYGYRNLRSFPLLVSFLEQPFIDVRVSFNSFVPKGLSKALTSKLVDYYIDQLTTNPSEHDKVEFNILFSCYHLTINQKLKKLHNHSFSDLEVDRIKYALLDLTNSVIGERDGYYIKDLDKVSKLESLAQDILDSDLSLIDKVYWLIQHCQRYGTLPFAGLARAGFMAVQFLNSLVEVGVFNEEQKQQYLLSLNTVGKQLKDDTTRLHAGQLSKEAFLRTYGHLRPGTYDICSKRYDEAFESYFGSTLLQTDKGGLDNRELNRFELTVEQRECLGHYLGENGLTLDATGLLRFISQAIEGREYGKFVFTKVLSEVLRLMVELGKRAGYSREDMAWVDISTVLELYATLTSDDLEEVFAADIQRHKRLYHESQSIRLPQVIQSTADIYDHFLSDVEPNFITRGRVTELLIMEENLPTSSLKDRIVMVQQADPGFDWIFSQNIAGLVTMFGGANSHMAIRCSELNIPAVIGCGEQNFQLWSKAKLLSIDCTNKQVQVVE